MSFKIKLFIIIIVVIIVRVFFIDSYKITSESMEGGLFVGEFVLVDKISIGSRIPSSFGLPFIGSDNVFFKMFGMSTHTRQLWNTVRLPGYSPVNKNDIIAFNFPGELGTPIDFKTVYIKRCIGIPGDTIAIQGGEVFVNGLKEKYLKTFQKEFDVVTRHEVVDWVKVLGVKWEDIHSENIKNAFDSTFIYRIRASPNVFQQIMKLNFVISVKSGVHNDSSLTDLDVFPYNVTKKNNIDRIKAYRLPKKGETLTIDSSNYDYLYLILKNCELMDGLEVRNNKLYRKGILVCQYRFKHDYFYMMGDNRPNSYDSRYWGFVPDDHLIGKARFVFFSNDEKRGVQWGRIFTTIK